MTLKGFVEAHHDGLFWLLVIALMVVANVALFFTIVELLTYANTREAQQFIDQCMALLETSAERCKLLWDWRK